MYDNPNDLMPVNNSLVQQVMNKSLIAREIVSQSNIALNKPKKSKLVYLDMFKMFFQCVSMLEQDKSRCMIFKVLTQYLCDEQNDQEMVDSSMVNLKNILETHFEHMMADLFDFIQSQNFKVGVLLS